MENIVRSRGDARADVTSNDNDGPLDRRTPAASSSRLRELDGEAFALRSVVPGSSNRQDTTL